MGVKRNAFTEAYKDDMYLWFWESYPQKASVWEGLFEVVNSENA